MKAQLTLKVILIIITTIVISCVYFPLLMVNLLAELCLFPIKRLYIWMRYKLDNYTLFIRIGEKGFGHSYSYDNAKNAKL